MSLSLCNIWLFCGRSSPSGSTFDWALRNVVSTEIPLALPGSRILVVEDEFLISLLIEDILQEHGCDVVGPAATVEHAMRLTGDSGFDAALLDVNLGDETVYPVADALVEAGVPFVFVTAFVVKVAKALSDQGPERLNAHA
jgi:CheY-like chemotaxis protein